MQRSIHLHVVSGFWGGVLAGAVVALWFLVVDVAAGAPFRTPVRLAGIVLGGSEPLVRAAPLLAYTALHFGVFVLLGVAASLVLRGLDVSPGVLVGGAFGVGVLNAVHYGGLLVTGADLLTVLPIGHVLLANLAAGVVMMIYLHHALASERPLGWKMLARYPGLVQGIVTGLLGALAVALWFFLVDIVAGRPFFTPAALGGVVLRGVTDADAVEVTVGIVGAYTVLHLLAFAVVGTGLVWVAERVEREPGLWLLSLLAVIVLEALFVGVAGTVSAAVLGAIGWVAIGIGNVVAVVVMTLWLLRVRPLLRARLSAVREAHV